MAIPFWQFVLSIIVFVIALFIIHELSRRFLKSATLFYLILLLSIPFWLDISEGWFRIAKNTTVLVPLCFLNMIRLAHTKKFESWSVMRKNWVFWGMYIVVQLNIAEVSVKDFAMGNYFNGIAGLLLCLTMARPPKAWRIDKKGKFKDFLVDYPIMWCLLYTTWNGCFVYAEHPDYLAHTSCILIVPLIYALFLKRADLWLSARAYTLAISLFIKSSYDFVTPFMDTSAYANENVLFYWGILNAIVHVLYAVWWFKGRKAAVAGS
jgi:hypothetical protein